MLFLAGDFLLRALGFYLVVIAMTASTLPVLQGYRDTAAIQGKRHDIIVG